MTDRIIELAKQVMTEACEHFGEDAPLKADLDLIHDEPETQWYLQRLAELVRNDALEDAANKCEEMTIDLGDPAEESGMRTCREAIRGMKS